MKKFLALVLVTVLTLSLSANVFAAENEESVQFQEVSARSEVTTLIYNTYNTSPSATTYISVRFPYRYCVIKAKSNAANGNSNIVVGIDLLKSNLTSTQNFFSLVTNNSLVSSEDYIDVNPNELYYIAITNSSNSSSISTHIECYSWE